MNTRTHEIATSRGWAVRTHQRTDDYPFLSVHRRTLEATRILNAHAKITSAQYHIHTRENTTWRRKFFKQWQKAKPLWIWFQVWFRGTFPKGTEYWQICFSPALFMLVTYLQLISLQLTSEHLWLGFQVIPKRRVSQTVVHINCNTRRWTQYTTHTHTHNWHISICTKWTQSSS